RFAPPALDAGEDAERDSEREAEDHRRQADLQRDARAPDDAAQDVAAELVGAEGVAVDGARTLEDGVGKLGRGVQRCEQRRPRSNHDHRDGQEDAESDRRIAAQQPAERPARRLHDDPGKLTRAGFARDRHYLYVIRGSTTAYSMSTTRLTVMMIIVKTVIAPWASG